MPIITFYKKLTINYLCDTIKGKRTAFESKTTAPAPADAFLAHNFGRPVAGRGIRQPSQVKRFSVAGHRILCRR